MNKSLLTNFIAFTIVVAGFALKLDVLISVGMFALSGAVTNWLAVHMLFEKVPGLYGSGVIPNRFEDFKSGIKHLMMSQFFTQENIDRFLTDSQSGHAIDLPLAPVIEKIDLSPAFDSLVQTIMQSQFGGMLGMFGGQDALMPLKEPFCDNMKMSLIEISQQDDFADLLRDELESPQSMGNSIDKIEQIIEQRLNELTPQLVKQIISEMIRKHLGWLVVWGGVFGGLIGLLMGLV